MLPSELLKESTARSHQRTEKALISPIRSIRTKEDYLSLLTCLYGYFHPLEKYFDQYLAGAIPDYEKRRKSERLLKDIHALGYPAPAEFSQNLPLIDTADQALGCFYVVEGSVLGGSVIKKMIRSQCEAIPEAAFSFLSGYYPDNAAMWRSFLALLNTTVKSEQQLQEVISSGNDCFTKLEYWIANHYGIEYTA